MVPDKFLIYFTSPRCGHCTHSFGDVILIGSNVLKAKNVMKIVRPKKNINVIMMIINYIDLEKPGIKDISKIFFSEQKNCIVQEKYFKDKDNYACVENIKYFRKIKYLCRGEFIRIYKNNQRVKWGEFVSDKINPKLELYRYYYPAYGVVETNNWYKKENPLLILMNVGYVKKNDNGEFIIDKESIININTHKTLKYMTDKIIRKEKLMIEEV
jgi:hypothetical protein